jgi:hypothetical protein
MPTLKVKNNGVWEKVAGGGSSGGSDSSVLIVTLDTDTMTASHSASEVYTATTNGKMVFAKSTLGAMYNLFMSAEEGAGFSTTVVESGDSDNFAESTYVFLLNDKTFSFASQKINGIPSGGTAGQVLTVGEDGKPVWVDAPSGSSIELPFAEEVEF